MNEANLLAPVAAALDARAALFDAGHEGAWRLCNGFLEGAPGLMIELYARTLLLHDHTNPPALPRADLLAIVEYLRSRLPWIDTVLLKTRHAADLDARRGTLLYGEAEALARRVREHGVWYALDLRLHRDTTFYPDTRHLRAWALAHLAGKTVLNTFAYTGSLGVAARAAGATRVVHLDLDRAYLNVAKASYTLNGFPIAREDFRVGDFWPQAGHLRRTNSRFDCVFLDPPFFALTGKGRVDLVNESRRIINKVRPLIVDGGFLVAINNALFVSGAAYLATMEELCADGYLTLIDLIPVPDDCTGYPETRHGALPADPAPFNHATKIAILRVRRKDAA